MENTKKQAAIRIMGGAGIVIILAVVALIYQSQKDEPVVDEMVNTEEVIATSTDAALDITESAPAVTPEEKTTNEIATTVNTNTDTAQIFLPEIELGPREKAVSPGDALRYFVEAVVGGDVERALSYMRKDVQEQYRASFEKYYQESPHPVVVAYYNGQVKDVQLVQPEYGLYLIDVFPSESELSYKVYAEYDSLVGEFVLTEL